MSHPNSAHLNSQRIFTCLHIGSNVKFSRKAAVLAVTHLFTVDPKIKRRVDRLEQQENVPSGPDWVDRKSAPVASGGVRSGHKWRVGCKGISHVGVDGFIIKSL